MNTDKVFEYKRTVVSNEIDELNHVNNVVYVQWVQDIAEMHWKVLTKDVPQDNLIWVVIKHEVDYVGQAVLGDEVILKTWVGKTGGVKSQRHVEVYNKEQLIVRAKTTWCLLNTTTYKPTRISEEMVAIMT